MVDSTSQLMRNSMAFVLAGGRGSRLKELTDRRAKPAVYFGGKTRIVDFALSNALNSGIRKMAIATQYKAHSLIRHCQRGWSFFRAERNEYLDILPASQRMSETQWYRGTADAVAQNIDIIDSYDVEYVLILAGDHIYKMDYERMIRQHVTSGADVTVGCLTVPRMEATAFGVMDVDANDRITSFLEKPADPPGTPADPSVALASMGIYVFSWAFLRDLLLRDMADPNSSHDFGSDLIPDIVKNGKAQAHRFTDSCVRHSPDAPAYWRDVGTVDAFWKANVDLTDFTPELDLWDKDWPIWTYSESVPPAKFVHDEENRRGTAVSSMVAGGCIISGTEIRQSLLFTMVKTNSYASLDQAVVLPYVNVARHARLTKVVIDRGVQIPEGLVVGEDPEEDARWFRVSEGRRHAHHAGHARTGATRRSDAGSVGRVRMRALRQDRRPGRCRGRAAARDGRAGRGDARASARLSAGDGRARQDAGGDGGQHAVRRAGARPVGQGAGDRPSGAGGRPPLRPGRHALSRPRWRGLGRQPRTLRRPVVDRGADRGRRRVRTARERSGAPTSAWP
jgi:glucose-1-phosphate adenylyltransferase